MPLSQRYNYYEILEIQKNAVAHEISEAYQRAKSTYSGNDPAIYTIFTKNEAQELVKMIDEAYLVLGNRNLKVLYDKKIHSERFDEKELTYNELIKETQVQHSDLYKQATLPQFTRDEAFEQEMKNCQLWDGKMLKQVREYKKLTLLNMTEITKINSFYITAVENMNPSELPAPVFVRGYINQIAKALGLNEKATADSYMTKFKTLTKEK